MAPYGAWRPGYVFHRAGGTKVRLLVSKGNCDAQPVSQSSGGESLDVLLASLVTGGTFRDSLMAMISDAVSCLTCLFRTLVLLPIQVQVRNSGPTDGWGGTAEATTRLPPPLQRWTGGEVGYELRLAYLPHPSVSVLRWLGI